MSNAYINNLMECFFHEKEIVGQMMIQKPWIIICLGNRRITYTIKFAGQSYKSS